MAHYAFLNKTNFVTEVITGRNETETIDGISDWEAHYSEIRGQRCLRTSYNGNIRKNYAGIGYKYDSKLDAFIPPKPYASWVLNKELCQWEAPVPYPEDSVMYEWNEQIIEWVARESF
jgi:hypothetical protein